MSRHPWATDFFLFVNASVPQNTEKNVLFANDPVFPSYILLFNAIKRGDCGISYTKYTAWKNMLL